MTQPTISAERIEALKSFPIRQSENDADYLAQVTEWWIRKGSKAVASEDDGVDWGNDDLLAKMERGTDRDPSKYTAMITVMEANQAASHIRALRGEVGRLMSEYEDLAKSVETGLPIITDDMVEQAWITYVDASMSPSISNLEAMRAVLEAVADLSALRAQAQGSEAVAAERDRLIEDCEQYKAAASAYFLELLELRHASPPVQAKPQGVVVKALEWVRPDGARSGETMRRVETVVGTYRVWTHHEANGAWFWQVGDGPARANGSGTEQECFADAQADYESRILSALATPPAPVDGGVTDAMIDAGLAEYSEGGCSGLDQRERREVVTSILTAALTASRAAVAQDGK